MAHQSANFTAAKQVRIAWLNGTSVAIGSESEVRTKAIDIFHSKAWQDTHVNRPTVLRVTTYGQQRTISEETL